MRKVERLYEKFCRDHGINDANLEVVSAAIAWHRLRSVQGATVISIARVEVVLDAAVEKVENITRNASISANQWAMTDEEPA